MTLICVLKHRPTKSVRAPQNGVDGGLHRLGPFARVALEGGELASEEVLEGLGLSCDCFFRLGMRVCVCVD